MAGRVPWPATVLAMIAWAAFTPWPAAIGGILIGLATVILILFNGRIAGISGILGGILRNPWQHDPLWRWAFIGGLAAAPWLYQCLAPVPLPHIQASTGTLLLSGLLVGFGTRYGSGCTSGHGVCGLSRFSGRSMAATACFFVCGIATVMLTRHFVIA